MSDRPDLPDVTPQLRAVLARWSDEIAERPSHADAVAAARAASRARTDERNTYRGGDALKRRRRT